jgi:pimeloyl-ACP methyl ester carboxylesterase
MTDATLTMPDGRTVGYADHGDPGDRAVVWCHGGPGSRLEPAVVAGAAHHAGIRFIGIDRPGYGLSTPWPERSIADWVPDGLVVADELGLERFTLVGVSTGGAYALATAAQAPDRVDAVVACCALTDMRWREGREMMASLLGPVWDAADRAAALAVVADQFGADGSKFGEPGDDALVFPEADIEFLTDPANLDAFLAGRVAMFAFGIQGYTDDRRADGVGWGSFDVANVVAPVVVLHGDVDPLVPVAHAEHTAEIVPGAALRIAAGLGHLSIMGAIVPTITGLRGAGG